VRIEQPGVYIQLQNLPSQLQHQWKDGQRIVAKIIRATAAEVLLNMGGETVRAKVDGKPPEAGSVFVFRVRVADGQRIELKPLANLSEGRALEGFFPKDHVLAHVLKEQGLSADKENLVALNRLLSELQLKLPLTPELKVAAFMLARGLPPSLGGYLLAWLHQDKRLRENLWNQLNAMGLLDKSAALNPEGDPDTLTGALWRLWKNSADVRERNGFAKAAMVFRENGQAAAHVQPETEVTREASGDERKGRWKTLADLLSHPATWSEKRAAGDEASAVHYGAFPFLVRMAGDKIRECVVHWEEKQRNAGTVREQTVHVLIPTEHLGEIALAATLSPYRPPHIRFQVETEEIRQFFVEQMADLRKVIGTQAKIEVETVTTSAALPEAVDVWM